MNIHEDFCKSWRVIHQGLNVEAELPYYSQVYAEMWELCYTGEHEEETRRRLLGLLIYIEDMAGLGLSKILKKEYRLAEDYVWQTIKNFDLTESAASDLQISIYLAIKSAPHSVVKRWVMQTFLNKNFDQLCILLHWLVVYLEPLNLVFPDIEIVEKHFESEFGTDGLPGAHELIASRWLEFSWRDKKGRRLVDLLRICLKDDLEKIAEYDDSFDLFIGDIDIYTVTDEYEDEEGRMTIIDPTDHEFPFSIKKPKNLPEDYRKMYLFGILVDWLEEDFMCEPYIWLYSDEVKDFEPEEFVALIKLELAEHEKTENLMLSTGEVVNRYEDLESEISFCGYGEGRLYLSEDDLNEDKNVGLRDKI